MAETNANRILGRIRSKGRGWVFSATDFTDRFSRGEIDVAFHRFVEKGAIRRIAQGLYDYPMYSEILGKSVAPDMQKAAEAIARKNNWRISPDGDTALNYLGLSTQVGAKNIYLSDGPGRRYQIGSRALVFKHATQKELAVKRQQTALVVQALKAAGEKQITDELLQKLSARFSPAEWRKIEADSTKVTGWVRQIIVHIADKKGAQDNG